MVMIYDLICIVEHQSYNFVVLITLTGTPTVTDIILTLHDLSIKIQGKAK